MLNWRIYWLFRKTRAPSSWRKKQQSGGKKTYFNSSWKFISIWCNYGNNWTKVVIYLNIQSYISVHATDVFTNLKVKPPYFILRANQVRFSICIKTRKIWNDYFLLLKLPSGKVYPPLTLILSFLMIFSSAELRSLYFFTNKIQ